MAEWYRSRDALTPSRLTQDAASRMSFCWSRGDKLIKVGDDSHDFSFPHNVYQNNISSFYFSIAAPLLERAGLFSSERGFQHAYALVSSRAFMVDAYHGLAMVPIADA